MESSNSQVTHLTDPKLIRPLRQYEGYWLAARTKGVVVVDVATEDNIRRYIQAIKKEKVLDQEHRHKGELRFSWVGTKLTVRFTRIKE